MIDLVDPDLDAADAARHIEEFLRLGKRNIHKTRVIVVHAGIKDADQLELFHFRNHADGRFFAEGIYHRDRIAERQRRICAQGLRR